VFFTGIAFSMVGVLQSMGQFNIPAAMSVASNGIVIVYYLLFCRHYGVFGLAWAFLLGWASQALIQIPWFWKNRLRYRPALRHPGLKQIFMLMLPVMVSTWIQPVNQLISTRFATHLFGGAGASAMDYANTLYTIITGILVLSITNVIFPEMSRMSNSGKEDELGTLIVTNIRGMLFLLLPLTVGLTVMAVPVIRLLYEWKSWDSFSTAITARALCFMSLGMVGYGIQNVLSRAFYAQQNGKLPLISGAVSIAVNLLLCVTLINSMDVAGLSLATAVSSTAAALILMVPTIRRFPKLWGRDFWLGIAKMTLCSVIMGIAVSLLRNWLSGSIADGLIGRAAVLLVPTVCGIVLYFALAFLLRLQELDTVKKIIRK
jgi:putative peptidoglycan lipid II flippase